MTKWDAQKPDGIPVPLEPEEPPEPEPIVHDMKNPIAAFQHSFDEPDLETAVKAAADSGINIIQLGPVGMDYMKGRGRRKLVRILKANDVKVGPLCVCYEDRPGMPDGVGVEDYSSISVIEQSGGYGDIRQLQRDDSATTLHRIRYTGKHLDLAAYLRDAGVMSSDRAILTTHVGFFSERVGSTQIELATREIVKYCDNDDTYLAIETGSETMKEVVRFIRVVEEISGVKGRLGINYDPANFIMYGTQDPLEALRYLKGNDDEGEYKDLLLGVHIKDAVLNDGAQFTGVAEGAWKGAEAKVGEGQVLWNHTLRTLYELGYRGPLVIEREDPTRTPAERKEDIIYARDEISKRMMDLRQV